MNDKLFGWRPARVLADKIWTDFTTFVRSRASVCAVVVVVCAGAAASLLGQYSDFCQSSAP